MTSWMRSGSVSNLPSQKQSYEYVRLYEVSIMADDTLPLSLSHLLSLTLCTPIYTTPTPNAPTYTLPPLPTLLQRPPSTAITTLLLLAAALARAPSPPRQEPVAGPA